MQQAISWNTLLLLLLLCYRTVPLLPVMVLSCVIVLTHDMVLACVIVLTCVMVLSCVIVLTRDRLC